MAAAKVAQLTAVEPTKIAFKTSPYASLRVYPTIIESTGAGRKKISRKM